MTQERKSTTERTDEVYQLLIQQRANNIIEYGLELSSRRPSGEPAMVVMIDSSSDRQAREGKEQETSYSLMLVHSPESGETSWNLSDRNVSKVYMENDLKMLASDFWVAFHGMDTDLKPGEIVQLNEVDQHLAWNLLLRVVVGKEMSLSSQIKLK